MPVTTNFLGVHVSVPAKSANRDHHVTIRPVHLALAAPALAAALAVPVNAQSSLELVAPEGFVERFSGNAQVSGQFLTGLAFINPEDDFDLSRIRVVYPDAEADGRLCVRLTSDDGRYWAANLYRSAEDTQGYPSVPLPTAYSDHLVQYGLQGLLFMVSKSADCQSTSGQTLLPAVLGAPDSDAELTAFVNVSQGRVASWLVDAQGTASERVMCEQPAQGAKVTYSHQCTLPVALGENQSSQQLVVSVRSLTGATSEQTYAVYLD